MLVAEIEMPLNAGYTVYHASRDDFLKNIVREGIHNVSNNWGGGELGPGFYAATTIAGAAQYINHQVEGGVAEISLTRQLLGAAVAPPARFDYIAAQRNVEIKKLCLVNDYLYKANTNPVLEYKFNFRCTRSLRVEAIHRWVNGAWSRESPEEYLQYYRDNIMLADEDDPVW